MINNEGEVIAWNKAMEDMTGVNASDMLGKGSHEYALPFYGQRRPILIDLALRPQEQILWKYASTARRAAEIVGEAIYARTQYRQDIYFRDGKCLARFERQYRWRHRINSRHHRTQAVEEELSTKTRRLEEFNAALKVLLKQREEDRTELEESILLNVKSLVVPYVEKLKKSRLGDDQMTYLTILESHMRENITSPLPRGSPKNILALVLWRFRLPDHQGRENNQKR